MAFSNDESAEDHFGPLFNGKSCVECHNAPAVGGAGALVETRFGRNSGGVFDPLANLGGSLRQAQAIPGTPVEVVPSEANVRAGRRTTSLLGAGLIEAIPDLAIQEGAARQKRLNPGQAGDVNLVLSASLGVMRVGRFGWKCQQAQLLDFAADAYENEMGVNSELFPFENVANSASLAVDAANYEDVADATGLRDIDRFANFMRFLAPPPSTATSSEGERTFHQIGCAVCHQSEFTTVSSIGALNGQTFRPYSDFLLHDVGTGDGIEQAGAGANKLRTPPLMGLSSQPSLLHDGSANSVEAAILAHHGQAESSRQGYVRLSATELQALRAFLAGL